MVLLLSLDMLHADTVNFLAKRIEHSIRITLAKFKRLCAILGPESFPAFAMVPLEEHPGPIRQDLLDRFLFDDNALRIVRPDLLRHVDDLELALKILLERLEVV